MKKLLNTPEIRASLEGLGFKNTHPKIIHRFIALIDGDDPRVGYVFVNLQEEESQKLSDVEMIFEDHEGGEIDLPLNIHTLETLETFMKILKRSNPEYERTTGEPYPYES